MSIYGVNNSTIHAKIIVSMTTNDKKRIMQLILINILFLNLPPSFTFCPSVDSHPTLTKRLLLETLFH